MSGHPTQIPKNGNGLLQRLAGRGRLNKPPTKLPKERVERYGKWWEMRLLGASIPEIVNHESKQGREYTEGQVSHGLDKYSELCMDEAGRKRRMAQHRAFVDKLRQIAMAQVQNLRKQYQESEGKGIAIRSEEVRLDRDKNVLGSKEKVVYEPVDKSMVPWLRFAVDLDKYAATIDGLMGDLEQESDLNIVDVNLEGFIGIDSGDENGT